MQGNDSGESKCTTGEALMAGSAVSNGANVFVLISVTSVTMFAPARTITPGCFDDSMVTSVLSVVSFTLVMTSVEEAVSTEDCVSGVESVLVVKLSDLSMVIVASGS